MHDDTLDQTNPRPCLSCLPADPPPCEGLKPLHSIKSGQQWDNSHSFYDNWK